MNTITQTNLIHTLNSSFSDFNNIILQLAYPFEIIPSVFNYAKIVESLNDGIHTFALTILQRALELIDTSWRNRPYRSQTYYVKNTRSRCIVTIFGYLEYKRTIYVNREDGSYYCHVDERLGLERYDRYAPCVKTKMAALYAEHNSMIAVGKLLGSQIFCNFSTTRHEKNYAIPRQTVHRCIKKLGFITSKQQRKQHTPSVLYIMADEKWIPLQEKKDNGKAKRCMSRCAVIFEGYENTYKNSTLGVHQRHKLVGKTILLGCENNIWKRIEDTLFNLYDIEKVKIIHIMGDGGSWIKAGVNELSTHHFKVDFTLDSFHLNQSILRISSNKEIRHALHKIIYIEQNKKLFKSVCLGLIDEGEAKSDRIKENMNYILNHWSYIMRRINEVRMPCAMEGAISHYIASVFTSIPKAYKEYTLRTYLNNREHILNGTHMLRLFLEGMDKKEDEENDINISETYLYEPTSPSTTYKTPSFMTGINALNYSKF